jgi:hypothetical protein
MIWRGYAMSTKVSRSVNSRKVVRNRKHVASQGVNRKSAVNPPVVGNSVGSDPVGGVGAVGKPVVKGRRKGVPGVAVSALLFLGLGLSENANAGTLPNDLTANIAISNIALQSLDLGLGLNPNSTTLNTADSDLALIDPSDLSLALDHLLGLNDALNITTLGGLRPLSAQQHKIDLTSESSLISVHPARELDTIS